MKPSPAFRTAVPFLALAVLLAGPGVAEAQLGVGAGLGFGSLDDIRTQDVEAAYESSTGYHVGVFYNVGRELLSVRPGVFYHRLGEYEFSPEQRLDLSAVEAALDLRFRVFSGSSISPYLLGAPVLTFARSDSDFSDAVEDLSLTADLGAGLEFSRSGSGLTLMPEFRYSIGVTDYLSESFQVGDVTVTPSSDGRRFRKVMLRLNVMF